MEKIRWRGTHGVGDFMQALNVAHRYSFDHDKLPVNLEMHWEHDEDYLYHPRDPETIIERMHKIHEMYLENNRVVVTHVYNSDMFHYEDTEQKVKNRFFFGGMQMQGDLGWNRFGLRVLDPNIFNDGINCLRPDFRKHDHSCSTTIGSVIYCVVIIVGEISQVVNFDINNS